jgi:two-component system, LytTR family, sensor kinase
VTTPAASVRRVYSRANVGVLLLLFTATGFLEFWYRFLDYAARGHSIDWRIPFIEQMTGNYASFALLFLVVTPVLLRARVDRLSWIRWLPIHVGAVLLYSSVHTSLLWGSRALIFPLLGMAPTTTA